MNLVKRKNIIAIEDEPKVTLPVFDNADRCDRCTAAAHAMLKTEPPLYFCMHHRVELGDNLLASGFEVVDDQMVIDHLTKGNR